MKTFKEIMEVKLLGEAMSGKNVLNFKGKDEIGDFWVVTNPTPDSELPDILFQADIFDIVLQIRGGLDVESIVGIYKKEVKAKKVAVKLLALEQKKRLAI